MYIYTQAKTRLEKIDIINQYVTDNEKRLKSICFKLYKGNDLWQDLFQEFYIELVKTNEKDFKNYDLGKLCSIKIKNIFYRRKWKGSGLEGLTAIELDDKIKHYETQSDRFDILDFIDKELSRPHGFAPMTVFIESMEKPLRQIAKETSINLCHIHRYKKEGQEKLYNLVKDDRYNQ